ncbi:c-type cytochrome [Sphingobacterium sp. Mn56C]|uniref:c-type cytochrome n=1 Tax=Sphingobacterium sp. Mn56C TaxID=3395261 RepID=UPI003BC071EB
MMNLKQMLTLFSISGLLCIISSFTEITTQEEKKDPPKNLKVLPKDITKEDLEHVMRGFTSALGVKCNYCHAAQSNGAAGLDFSSDANPRKEVTRSMIKMTHKINKKYFNMPHQGILQNISCITCHNGQSIPKTITIN